MNWDVSVCWREEGNEKEALDIGQESLTRRGLCKKIEMIVLLTKPPPFRAYFATTYIIYNGSLPHKVYLFIYFIFNVKFNFSIIKDFVGKNSHFHT